MTYAGARPVRFLLDTNFLTIPGRFKVDVFDELGNFGKDQVYTLDIVVRELEDLARGSGKDASDARIGMLLLKKRGVKILSTQDPLEHTDDAIVRYSRKGKYTVCTLDKALISKLKSERIPVISLRQGRYLERVN